MRIGELAKRAGTSTKAIRYYEQLGLISPTRERNGYRSFGEREVRAVAEIRELSALGIAPARTRPFLDCLDAGHEHGDECVGSLAVYRDAISEIDRIAGELARRRGELQRRLDAGAERTFRHGRREPREHEEAGAAQDFTVLPEGLPVPADDGAASHLTGRALPGIELPASDGGRVRLDSLGPGRTVIYLYPLTGRPGVDLPEGWDAIPGARGCSTEACGFRDHFSQLREAGAAQVFGLSGQAPDYQAEVAERLRLPFAMLSDERLELADALGLPTFSAPGHHRLYSRLTLIVEEGAIEHVFYPVFPPDTHAQQVIAWFAGNPRRTPAQPAPHR